MTALALLSTSAAVQDPAIGTTSYIVFGIWIFVLAAFVGLEVIAKVPPTLHTPLMSGANAISGITLVGALFCATTVYPSMSHVFGFLAIIAATINVVGGFFVTDRMLRFFKRKPSRQSKESGS